MREYFLNVISLLVIIHNVSSADNIIKSSGSKNSGNKPLKCSYNNIPLSEDIFKLWSGYGCYNYTPMFRFKDNYYMKFIHNSKYENVTNSDEYFPYVQENDFKIYYDYTDEFMSKIIEETFIDNLFYLKWRDCAEKADKCCKNVLRYSADNENTLNCKALWDGWECFPTTKADETVYKPCPSYIYTSSGPTCTHYSSKYCSTTGKWNSTSYDSCIAIEEGTLIHEYYVVLLFISILFSMPASIIFTSYYKLRVTRVKLHNNLIISIIIRNIFILWSILYIIFDNVHTANIEETVQYQNGFWCKFVVFFTELSTNWMFGAMVLDAFYMYQILVRTFESNPPMKYYYGFIAAFCVIATTIWGLIKFFTNNEACWMISNDYGTWINVGLRGGMLLFNTCLLLCVMRVIIEKLRRHINNANHIKIASKATLVLTPLFGVQFFLTSYHLPSTSCLVKETYYYIGYTVDGLLGFIVSMLYCFLNREVQILLASSVRDFRTSCQLRKRIARARYEHTQNSNDTLNTYRIQQNISGTLMTPADSYHSLALKTIHINTKACINNCNYCEQSNLSHHIIE